MRELKNTVERSVYRSEDPDAAIGKIHVDPFDSPYLPGSDEPPDPDDPPRVPERRSRLFVARNLKNAVRELEIDLISGAMERSRYNQRQAADYLGLSYHQLRAYLKKHGLTRKFGRARRPSARASATGGSAIEAQED